MRPSGADLPRTIPVILLVRLIKVEYNRIDPAHARSHRAHTEHDEATKGRKFARNSLVLRLKIFTKGCPPSAEALNYGLWVSCDTQNTILTYRDQGCLHQYALCRTTNITGKESDSEGSAHAESHCSVLRFGTHCSVHAISRNSTHESNSASEHATTDKATMQGGISGSRDQTAILLPGHPPRRPHCPLSPPSSPPSPPGASSTSRRQRFGPIMMLVSQRGELETLTCTSKLGGQGSRGAMQQFKGASEAPSNGLQAGGARRLTGFDFAKRTSKKGR